MVGNTNARLILAFTAILAVLLGCNRSPDGDRINRADQADAALKPGDGTVNRNVGSQGATGGDNQRVDAVRADDGIRVQLRKTPPDGLPKGVYPGFASLSQSSLNSWTDDFKLLAERLESTHLSTARSAVWFERREVGLLAPTETGISTLRELLAASRLDDVVSLDLRGLSDAETLRVARALDGVRIPPECVVHVRIGTMATLLAVLNLGARTLELEVNNRANGWFEAKRLAKSDCQRALARVQVLTYSDASADGYDGGPLEAILAHSETLGLMSLNVQANTSCDSAGRLFSALSETEGLLHLSLAIALLDSESLDTDLRHDSLRSLAFEVRDSSSLDEARHAVDLELPRLQALHLALGDGYVVPDGIEAVEALRVYTQDWASAAPSCARLLPYLRDLTIYTSPDRPMAASQFQSIVMAATNVRRLRVSNVDLDGLEPVVAKCEFDELALGINMDKKTARPAVDSLVRASRCARLSLYYLQDQRE